MKNKTPHVPPETAQSLLGFDWSLFEASARRIASARLSVCRKRFDLHCRSFRSAIDQARHPAAVADPEARLIAAILSVPERGMSGLIAECATLKPGQKLQPAAESFGITMAEAVMYAFTPELGLYLDENRGFSSQLMGWRSNRRGEHVRRLVLSSQAGRDPERSLAWAGHYVRLSYSKIRPAGSPS